MNISKPSRFPDPRRTDENGIVAVGGVLDVDSLVDAYAHGIFPWPHKGLPLLWFSPLERGVLLFEDLHIPRSFSKWLKKTELEISFDSDFDRVVAACAVRSRPGQNDTWITEEMRSAYSQMHRDGYAHSVECWRGEELVGGLYGVYVGGVFSAESMFYLDSGASKLCLLALIEKLMADGHSWLDTQMITPVVESFGGRYIPRAAYLQLLKETQNAALSWSPTTLK